jgi:DNA polymerase III delta subunit
VRFLIYGEDTFRSRRALAAAKARFTATRDPSGMNVAVLRAEDDDADRVAEALFSSPFLADCKLVVMENYLSKAAKTVQSKVAEMLPRLPESTVAIFFESCGAEPISGSPLFADLSRQEYSAECRALDLAAAAKFVRDECARHGLGADPVAARMLVSACAPTAGSQGADSWRLHQEAAKLCSYASGCGASKVTPAMVREAAPGNQEESVFSFIDACAEGRGRDAALSLERLYATGASEGQVAALLLKQFRLLLTVRDAVSRGESDRQALSRKLGAHPFAVGKAMALARRLDGETLKERYLEILEMDRDSKTGRGKLKVRLGLFAAKLGMTKQGARS